MSVLRLSKHIWQMVNAHLINFTSKLAYLIQKSYIPFFFLTVNFILNKIRMLFSKVFFDTMTGSEQIYLRNHQCIHISRTGSFRFHWWMYPSSTSFPSLCWIVWNYHMVYIVQCNTVNRTAFSFHGAPSPTRLHLIETP